MPRPPRSHRSGARSAGFTLIEAMIVVAIIAVIAALAVPSIAQFSSNQRLHDMARIVESGLALARGEAMRTGNVHLVFFGADTAGAPLVWNGGNVDMLVVDDGLPGSATQNCLIDANEGVIGYSLPVQGDVVPAPNLATAPVDSDNGGAPWGGGTTFTQPDGATVAFWVMFQPDGTTRSFANDCSTGGIGSGAGAVYLNNAQRDVAIVLTPLGATRVHSWDATVADWTD